VSIVCSSTKPTPTHTRTTQYGGLISEVSRENTTTSTAGKHGRIGRCVAGRQILRRYLWRVRFINTGLVCSKAGAVVVLALFFAKVGQLIHRCEEVLGDLFRAPKISTPDRDIRPRKAPFLDVVQQRPFRNSKKRRKFSAC